LTVVVVAADGCTTAATGKVMFGLWIFDADNEAPDGFVGIVQLYDVPVGAVSVDDTVVD
jgi:hypothetical protein